VIEITVLNLENLVPLELVYALSEENVVEVLHDVVDAARNYWVKLASEQFHTTKTTYINGIQEVSWQGNEQAIISLVGVLPNILEQGMSQKDLHDTLLGPQVPTVPRGERGKHARAEGGSYRSIPFRHYTPGAGAHGATMGSPLQKLMGTEWANELGKDIYRAAKKLAPTLTDPYTGKTSWGERLDTENVREVETRAQVYIPKLKPYHASNIYQGMVRMQKDYEKGSGSTYMTFRTISMDAEGESIGSSPWIRPASPGAFLAKQVADHMTARLAPMAFQKYVDKLR